MDYLFAELYYMGMRHELLKVLMFGEDPRYYSPIERTFDSYYGIQATDAGGVDLTIDGRHYELEGEWVWCTYPGPDFRYAPLSKYGYWSHRFVTFAGSRVEAWVAQGLLPFAPQALAEEFHLGQRIDALHRCIQRTDRSRTRKQNSAVERRLWVCTAYRPFSSGYRTI